MKGIAYAAAGYVTYRMSIDDAAWHRGWAIGMGVCWPVTWAVVAGNSMWEAMK